MALPCLAGMCAADNARARLASGEALSEMQRDELQIDARGCVGPQRDPWGVEWSGCPAKVAMQRPDIDAALTLRGLSKMSPLTGWPRGYNGRVVETWTIIDAERAALQAEREARR